MINQLRLLINHLSNFLIMECSYCQRIFSTMSNLKYHQKHAKYCLSLQGSTRNLSKFICDFCEASYTAKHSLSGHMLKCPDKKMHDLKSKHKERLTSLKTQIKEVKSADKYKAKEISKLNMVIKNLEKKNKELETQLDEHKGIVTGLKTAPDKRTIYNTAYVHPKLVNLPVGNIPALTQEYMIEKVNDGILTYEKAAKGYSGMLDVIGELITHENDKGEMERNYVCTDVSRNSFHRLLESKKWKSDKGGRYLNNMLDTFRGVMEEYKNRAYEAYEKTPHDSIEWGQVDWERKNISLLYSGIVSREGKSDREELVNILRKEISKRASV